MRILKKPALMFVATVFLAASSLLPTYSTAFAKYDGVRGEALGSSEDPAFGINLGVPTTKLGSAMGAVGNEATFHRDSDFATPVLAQWAQANRQFRTLDVFVPNWRGEYDHYELTNATVTGYRYGVAGASGGDELTISFSGAE